MKNKICFVFFLLMLLLSACGPKRTAIVKHSGGSQAWIDAPLPGSKIPLEPVEIVAHAASFEGITFFEIDLNGQLLANTLPDSGSLDLNLAYTRYIWQPAAPGTYLIEVKAFDNGNQPGTSAESLVEVVEATPTPVATATPTSTPTLVSTATATPTSTATPTKTPLPGPTPIVFSNNRVNVSQIYVWGNSCGRKEVDIYITVPAASKVTAMTINYRMVDNANSSHVSVWVTEAMHLVTPGGTEWLITVSPDGDIPESNTFLSATLNYQFTATNSQGTKTSASYNNVSVSYCRR
jgi:hypothetical protein